ncbi:MAG: hypothetical protein KC546_16120 [Anaerolineae bacterium]|nr:hypothetical protein [Anaerolineae bacterium]MCA9895012.1 hypothetical protein [Anaerolineae bacterium]
MTEAVEKFKRKGKPRTDRYSQNEAFAVIVFSLAVMLFFWLDELIGAVDLNRSVAPLFALAITYLTPSVIVFLHYHWQGKLKWWVWVEIIVITVVGIVATPLWLIQRLFFILIPYYLPFKTLVCVLICILAIWFMARRISLSLPRKLVKTATYSVLCFTIFYSLGASWDGSLFGSTNFGTISINGHNYILIAHHDYDDPDVAVLYECNSLSFGCFKIYSDYNNTSHYFQRPRDRNFSSDWYSVLELTQGEHDNVLVLVDGEVVFDSSE